MQGRIFLSATLISLSFNAVAETHPLCDPKVPQVATKTGKLCGIKQTRYDEEAFAYLGIPYAKPPVGKLRWQPPQPIASWQPKIYPATQAGPECVQPPGAGHAVYAGDENCLYLNVWRPIKNNKNLLPVMVFIPGGGFLVGQGGLESYNGTYLANSGNVVVVTLNYRLGSLGFLRYEKNHSDIAGNFGLLDQLTAMQWVHDNIKNFGGDPSKVTLFGESAGAMSVGLHLFSIPKSQPLFRAAIMESNVMSIPYASAQQGDTNGAKFAALLCKMSGKSKCPMNGKWLRSLSVNTIMRAENKLAPSSGIAGLLLTGMTKGSLWAPIVGVDPVISEPVLGYGKGIKPKPFVFGLNQDEGVFFMPNPSKLSNAQYQQLLVTNFGKANAQRILNFKVNGHQPYNPNNYKFDKTSNMSAAAQAMANTMTHYAFASAMLLAAKHALQQQNNGGYPIFVYYFTQPATFNYAGPYRCNPRAKNICHTDEIPFVFHNFVSRHGGQESFVPKCKITTNEMALSKMMAHAWTSFAHDPYDWQKGWGRPPFKSVDKGPVVHWQMPVKDIDNFANIVNYQLWMSVAKKSP